jgi:hypothetical protein
MTTALEEVLNALKSACDHNAASEKPPEVLLWCDPGEEFSEVLPLLRAQLPQLLTFGNYDPRVRTGPALWLRAVAAGGLTEYDFEDLVPIIYLPGVARDVLRGAEDCPVPLQPLVWFSVSGCFFGHVNGKDWTLRALLTSNRAPIQLDIADDAASRASLKRAAARLLLRDLGQLRQKMWDAAALDHLLVPDLAADMLDWLNGSLDEGDASRFSAFSSQASRELGVNPSKTSREVAADSLAKREGRWSEVWTRFASSSRALEGVQKLLRAKEPIDLFQSDAEVFPRANARQEDSLRKALTELSSASEAEARGTVLKLADEHSHRRETVWADLGEAPLAEAVHHLRRIAAATPLPGLSSTELGEAYYVSGWEVDWSALQALAATHLTADQAAVSVVLRSLYKSWLDGGARALQELARSGNVPFATPAKTAEDYDILLFVDGLRMDLARELLARISRRGLSATLTWTWSGFPTVTATCKTLLSPAAPTLRGSSLTPEFLPSTREGKPANKANMDKLLLEAGWSLGTDLAGTKAWCETGRFDEEGHALGEGLAERVDSELDRVVDTITKLSVTGRRIRVVTDHGWLLMPGGLEKAHLDVGLAEPNGKRSRCAIVKDATKTSLVKVPWTWDEAQFVAAAPGACSFYAAQPYAHGGISPQECVLPVLDIAASSQEMLVSIAAVEWTNLRVRISVPGGSGLKVELRTPSQSEVLAGPKELGASGDASLIVGDEHQGEFATVVVLTEDGSVVAEKKTVIGDN